MTDMTEYPPERWQQVWAAIDSRREQLRMSLADLYRATGTSEGTYRKMRIDGIGVKRHTKRLAICDGLRWTGDSIDRLLLGLDPTPLESIAPELPQFDQRTNEVLNRISEAMGDITALRELVEQEQTRLAAVEERVARLEIADVPFRGEGRPKRG